MKKLFLLTFCLTFSSLFAQKSIQQVLQNYLDEEKLAGISVMIWQDDQLKINEHAGFQDLESQTPILSQSLFRLASMTKPLTTVAFMKLVEEGKIRLETPLETYIPQYANLKVYKESGEYEELKRPLIMKDLLMHTSGIGSGSLGNTPVDVMIRDHDFSEVKTLAKFVETFAEFPLIHQPGEGFTYSVNTDILARVIELISGQNFGDYLHKNVLKPLKMNHTFFQVPESEKSNMTSVYAMSESGLEKIAGPDKGFAPFARGNTGLVSTPEDYLRFTQMLLNGGKLGDVRILKKKTVELMTTNHLPDAIFPIDPMEKDIVHSGFGLGFAVVNRKGQLWAKAPLSITQVGNLPEGSFYWLGALNTYFWVDPGNGVTGVIMSQSRDVHKLHLFQEVVEGFYGENEEVSLGNN